MRLNSRIMFLLALVVVLQPWTVNADSPALSEAWPQKPAFYQASSAMLQVNVYTDGSDVYSSFSVYRVTSAQKFVLVFQCDQMFSERHRTRYAWDASGRVWVYSGDVGTFFWEADSGQWTKHAAADFKQLKSPFD